MRHIPHALAGAAALFAVSSFQPARAATWLEGSVRAPEGTLEGVLVSAKATGSNITTTVVSDAQGRYRFPEGRLAAGEYALSIRAIGYDLASPARVTLTDGAKPVDIALSPTRDLGAQMTNAEWIMSMPGDEKLKDFLTDCTGCHTLHRVVGSEYTADDFPDIFKRMGAYSPGSTPENPQPLLPGPRGERPRVNAAIMKPAADLLAHANLSAEKAHSYALKTLPRPKGRATKVVITEYDLPRREAQPHDVIVTKDGQVWFSDFAAQFVGTLDPATGKATDFPIPTLKPEQPKGSLQIDADAEGNLWVAMMYQAGLTKFDPVTKKAIAYPVPKEWQSPSTQESMVAPMSAHVDGKVWTNNQETHSLYRLDVKTGKFEDMGEPKDAGGKSINGYGIPVDAKNQPYLLEFGNTRVGRFDPVANELVTYPTPSLRSRPRRGRFDEQGRLWFAEYAANAIGMFDPKSGAMTEYRLPTPWSNPYDAVYAKGEAWTGSMSNDQVARLDVASGEFVEYLLPRSTNIRRVFLDDRGTKPVLWIGSNHGGSVIKVEPQD
jgi:streptogramin lyase